MRSLGLESFFSFLLPVDVTSELALTMIIFPTFSCLVKESYTIDYALSPNSFMICICSLAHLLIYSSQPIQVAEVKLLINENGLGLAAKSY